PQKILFWNPEKRFSKFPLRAPFAVLHQKNLTTPVTIRKQPSMSKMIPSEHEERLYPRAQTPGPINLTLRGWLIHSPKPIKKMPEDKKPNGTTGYLSKKDVPLKTNNAAPTTVSALYQ
ncbi:hypothetical protein, partial [Escherichia coli]|uniref:hypothetical protein n=1 Tax=Escherichia coli TaxID=562 RepID=UPI001BB47844